MSKRKPIDKQQARQRRDRLLDVAAAARLSLTEGVREMRAIAGMTQEEFAQHRGVSARVVKALELGKGNPTVATLNRIGEFFGLEVAFVPVKRQVPPDAWEPATHAGPATASTSGAVNRISYDAPPLDARHARAVGELQHILDAFRRESEAILSRLQQIPGHPPASASPSDDAGTLTSPPAAAAAPPPARPRRARTR